MRPSLGAAHVRLRRRRMRRLYDVPHAARHDAAHARRRPAARAPPGTRPQALTGTGQIAPSSVQQRTTSRTDSTPMVSPCSSTIR
jgi:hypothetical protein